MIIAIVIVQIADNFSGILILPLSRFVYYGLSMSPEIQAISRIVFAIGLLLIIISVIKFGFLKRFGFSRLHLNRVQTSEGNSVVYLAGQILGNRKSIVRSIPAKKSELQNNTDSEHGIVMVSCGCIVFANKVFFKITGYQPLDVFGRDFASFIRHDSLIDYTMLSRMSADEILQSTDIHIITKNDNQIVANLSTGSEIIFEHDAVNVFYLNQVKDTDDRSQSLNALFFEPIEHVGTLHWIWDDKGIIYLNNNCRSILPFDLGKIISKPGLMLKLVPKEERNAIRSALHAYLGNGVFNEDIHCRLQNGEEKYYRVSIGSQLENKTFPKRNHAIAYDITNEILSLQDALSAAHLAETANNNKTAFLANMSHEIRSPLNGIIGFSELLADKNLTDGERERYLNIIHNNGNALITLLSDLIDISKLESGKLVLTNRKFIPELLLEELKYQFEGSASGKSGEVKINFTNLDSLRNQEIESDPNRLRQILVNLISNAIKFTSKGHIEIGADFTGEEMLFWVKDTGIGIPCENHQHIFERFRQVNSPDSAPVLGFGLGLAISKALVEILGGRLWVESSPDKGSLFTFTIKTNVVNQTMETTQNNNSAYPYDFKERTILVAEDIDFSFLYLEAVLRRTGVKILWAQNGREAIEHVKTNHSIDLILMDMHMPVMNGYEASEIISKLEPGIPIIAQTAFVLPEDTKKCFAAGCSGYLSKPIRKEQLLNTLSEYFDSKVLSVNAPLYKVGVG